jgi:hypothetical protein
MRDFNLRDASVESAGRFDDQFLIEKIFDQKICSPHCDVRLPLQTPWPIRISFERSARCKAPGLAQPLAQGRRK